MGTLLLAFLELTFVMFALLLFHSLRKTVGFGMFYLAVGLFFVLGQTVSSTNVVIDPGIAGFQVNLGHTVLMAPYMVALLVVYAVDGTLEAQRLIIGLIAVLFCYCYMTWLLASHCAWSGENLLIQEIFETESRRILVAGFLVQAVNLFVLPILFQLILNKGTRLFLSLLGTLVTGQVIDSFLFQLCVAPASDDWWRLLGQTYLARATGLIWLSVLATLYLRFQDMPVREKRSSFGIIFDFFSGYVKARQLQKHLREWAGRYQLVVENSSDLILVVDADGVVMNANRAASQFSAFGQGSFVADKVEQEGKALVWKDLWEALGKVKLAGENSIQTNWKTVEAGKAVELDVSISSAAFNEYPVAIVTGRDVTERRELEREQEQLKEHLVHSQRLEAVGRLAGGVAHDFNNMLHSIRCSIEKMRRPSGVGAQEQLLSNVDEAVERAGALTNQLLGFARRGKYDSRPLEINLFVQGVRQLFEPMVKSTVSLKWMITPRRLVMQGDENQLKQVFMNLLINAHDALMESDQEVKKIVFRVEQASAKTAGWDSRPQETGDTPEDYICIRVKDNGPGISDEVKEHVFEPFFTTKPIGKGTGMGLAMVYGCVAHHGGWIHLASEVGKGTEFFLFFPCA